MDRHVEGSMNALRLQELREFEICAIAIVPTCSDKPHFVRTLHKHTLLSTRTVPSEIKRKRYEANFMTFGGVPNSHQHQVPGNRYALFRSRSRRDISCMCFPKFVDRQRPIVIPPNTDSFAVACSSLCPAH